MTRVLVTGGAGFIGSHVVDELVAIGIEVRILDSLTSAAHQVRPDYLNPDVELVTADVGDASAVARAVLDVDAVCHQAARVGLGKNFSDAPSYVRDNDMGTAVLLEALYANGFHGRFVLASSMVVYGEGAYECPRHGSVRPGRRHEEDLRAGQFEPRCPTCGATLAPGLVDEDAVLDPRNVYAATKLHQEHLSISFGAETGSPITRLRYHNVYGPRMPRDTPYAGVASLMRSAFAAGQSPAVFEDGGQRRDFVHVRDVAHANICALLSASDNDAAGAFNVASGDIHTIAEMGTALLNAYPSGTAAPVITGEFRVGDVRHITASPGRAHDRLGFRARINFLEGMRSFAHDPLRTARVD